MVVPCTLPDDLRSFLGQLVPAAVKQALDLQQLSILEDVGRGLLAAPGFCRGLPRGRLAHHRGGGTHPGCGGKNREGGQQLSGPFPSPGVLTNARASGVSILQEPKWRKS